MNPLLRRLNLWHGVALLLLAAPVLVVFVFGALALWRSGDRFVWLAGLALVMALGWGLQWLLRRRNLHLLADAVTTADPGWAPSAERAWQEVDAFAATLTPEEWPLDGNRLLDLGRRTLELVAHRYHPGKEQPLLELTVPHTLMIVERACRDLRADISDNIPFSHRLTLGDLVRARRWQGWAERTVDVYRAGRILFNPVDAILGEVKRHVLGESFGLARLDLHRWLLGAYVRKVGRYAIDIYSGRIPLDDGEALTRPSAQSRSEMHTAAGAVPEAEEPLRIVVAGRSNAGKSSLINALFGSLTAATDVLADTTSEFTPHLLSREGLVRALVFDTPGVDGSHFNPASFDRLALSADLILWVTPAHRPDRALESARIAALRAHQDAHPERPAAPMIVCASHVDQLRPVHEWNPPYDLANPDLPKARNIRAAIEVIAADLGVSAHTVIPVCLRGDRVYNVDDALWAAMLDQQNQMLGLRLMRCLDARRREQNWGLVWKQLRGAGRWLGGRLGR